MVSSLVHQLGAPLKIVWDNTDDNFREAINLQQVMP